MINRIKTSLHDRRVGLTHEDNLMCQHGFIAGPQDRAIVLPGHPDMAVLFDDFLTFDVTTDWLLTEGTDAATISADTRGQGVGGVLRLTTGDTGTGLAADTAQVKHRKRLWRAAYGNLTFQVRAKISQATDVYVYLGFTDVTADTLEAPIMSSGVGNGLTTNASNAVGFMVDTRMTADTIWCTGVRDDVDATAFNTGVTPTTDLYRILRIDLDTEGNATFYRDGHKVGYVAGAVEPNTALTPILTISKTTGASSVNLDIDYVNVYMNREP